MKYLISAILVFIFFDFYTANSTIEKTVYFEERFEDGEGYKQRWVESTFKEDDQGSFRLATGKFYGDAEKNLGIQTSQDNRFYGISAKFEPFSNENKTLVIQFSVKHEQDIECGGGYIKLFQHDLDQTSLNGDTKYLIMFGPDICGPSNKKIHLIFNYQGKMIQNKKEMECKDDHLTHVYTLILKPDNTYVVKVDNEKIQSGKIKENFDFVSEKFIKDPNAKKPDDWQDNEKIDDPTDKEPVDWDQPEFIPDPNSEKPKDWDEVKQGKWERSQIKNPEYKGEWKPRQIDNPKYKGKWTAPEIENPDFKPEELFYRYENIGLVGFDLWQVKSGTIFDNILITDNAKYAEEFARDTWGKTKDVEKEKKEKADEEERKRRDEERREFESRHKDRYRDRDDYDDRYIRDRDYDRDHEKHRRRFEDRHRDKHDRRREYERRHRERHRDDEL